MISLALGVTHYSLTCVTRLGVTPLNYGDLSAYTSFLKSLIGVVVLDCVTV